MPLTVCARTTFQGLLDNSSLFANVLRHLLTCWADSNVICLEVLMDVFLGAIDVGTTGSILTCSHLAQTIHNRTSCFREIQIKGNRPESLALPLPGEYSKVRNLQNESEKW
jgi:hypothetical protein